MKFINSAAKAFDGICSTVDALASASDLLANKISKEISIQQANAQKDIRHEIKLHEMELEQSMADAIAKQQKLQAQNPWAFAQARRVLNGEPIQWGSSSSNDVTIILD